MQTTVLPEEKDFSSPAYRKSRNAYLWECAFEYFVTLLVSETFLANLLSYMEFAEQEIGVISSLVSLAFVFQLLSLLLVQTPFRRKSLVLVFDTCGQLLFLCLYVLPFLPVDAVVRKVLVFVLILAAYMCQYVVANIKFQWGNSYVHPKKRASYSATKEIVSLITGICFTLAMGAIYDAFVSADNLVGGFLFIAVVMLVVDVCNFICLALIKKDEPKAESKNKKASKIFLRIPSRTKVFVKLLSLRPFGNAHIIFLWALWGRLRSIWSVRSGKLDRSCWSFKSLICWEAWRACWHPNPSDVIPIERRLRPDSIWHSSLRQPLLCA